MRLPRDKDVLENARALRKSMTREERHLWYDFLRGYSPRFVRQKVVGRYILDFYCDAAGLAIELDGSQHYEAAGQLHDAQRTEYLEGFGIRVLRFSNLDVMQHFEGVCRVIDNAVKSLPQGRAKVYRTRTCKFMPTLNIVLVEPQIPQNSGNIARTCAVTGARLHIVGPMGFTIDDKKLKRAGLDYWHQLDITYYQDQADFFAKNSGPFFYFTSKGPRRHVDVTYPDGAYLVFGREDAGLPEELLAAHEADCVRMPMRRGERCLNLSNAVAVGVYEALRQWDFAGLETHGQLTRYEWSEDVK